MQISSIGSSSGTDSVSIAKMMEEIRKKMLEKLDKNGDGKLDATELADVADKTDTKVDDLLTQFDNDTDGTLSKTEANKMFETMRPKGPPPEMFDNMDQDGDNNIDETELAKFADMTGTKASDLLTKFDEDGDGVLSKTEANTMFEAMKPKGPPPDQQASNLEETDSSKELKSLLDALDESDDKKTTEDLFAQYLQNLVQKYNVNNSYNNDGIYNTNGATNSQLLDIQA